MYKYTNIHNTQHIYPDLKKRIWWVCNEHGTIYAISSDFDDRMTTQSMGLMLLSSWTFLDLRDEVKMPYKAKHEERTQRNAELDEFYWNQ
jgi:hypothetical protein